MACARCGAEPVTASGWCADCERQHDAWSRQHAADILWQAFTGAGIAMVVALGGLLLGLSPLLGILGVLLGTGTFVGLRAWSKARRRRQFQAGVLPRAYLPSRN
jgi:Flp pilus assembly protein TadB